MSHALTLRLVLISLLTEEHLIRRLGLVAFAANRHLDCDCMECRPWTY